MDYKVVKNKFGFHEIENKPDQEFLINYYQEKYYSGSNVKLNQYQKSYSKEELIFISNRANRKREILVKHRPIWMNSSFSVLDIGCGEGWNLKFFSEMGSDVLGVEYQSDACANFNRDLCEKILVGDIWKNIEILISKEKFYDVVILDNVLEHVTHPEETIGRIKKLLAKNGIVIIEVPNDFSILQKKLKDEEKIDHDFWLAPPDHLSYFNMCGLNSLLTCSGFEVLEESCDFPIDLNIFNPDTNYVKDKSKGRNVHLGRVSIENLFDSISVEQTNLLYSIFAKMGLGRNIIGYYTLLK